ncbi:4'-phosphopantetheinyl transferase superfamily protein [Paenibacillus lautus]|uniref:4'-phosphopantetheinyl transferase family protein n=1 Tax=Paenibacillus lautus TaxID=1401 RepID=UPI002DBAD714|nr:4'-phosphopantetheinyl transferase superfamily protein [Paenibacillus lautus]MEC0202476.1 4'-phosphopantetheinyl transferase superfamily protein [Paenibacillus lautus]
MDTFHADQPSHIEVYAIQNSDQIRDETFRALFHTLSPDRQDYVSKFRRASDYQRSVLGDAMVHRILRDKLGLDPKNIEIIRNAYGKPFLKDHDNLHFNVSHSGHWIVCAVSHEPVGIDVEKIEAIDMDIAKRYFHKTEFNALLHCDPSVRLSRFFDLWTLKESYIKAVGKGLHLALDSFALALQDGEWDPIVGEDGETYYFKQYAVEEGYKLSVCGISRHFPKNVHFVTAEEL